MQNWITIGKLKEEINNTGYEVIISGTHSDTDNIDGLLNLEIYKNNTPANKYQYNIIVNDQSIKISNVDNNTPNNDDTNNNNTTPPIDYSSLYNNSNINMYEQTILNNAISIYNIYESYFGIPQNENRFIYEWYDVLVELDLDSQAANDINQTLSSFASSNISSTADMDNAIHPDFLNNLNFTTSKYGFNLTRDSSTRIWSKSIIH